MVSALISTIIVAHSLTATPVILDTDLGDDIDDTWALMQLLGMPELDVKLITTASDNTPVKTRLVAKMLERTGHYDIPLGTGHQNSDKTINQATWLGDYTLDDYPGTVHEDGVGALIRTVMESDEPITIIVIGPQTNLKVALEREPKIAENANIVTMAGSVYEGYRGADEPAAEWNVRRDSEAAQAVFAAPWDITMAPLDICGELQLKGDRYRAVADAGTPRANVLVENYDAWKNRKRYGEFESSILFDTVAVYLAYDNAYCRMETLNLIVDDEGYTRVNDEDGRPVHCALDWNDEAAFQEMLVNAITTGK